MHNCFLRKLHTCTYFVRMLNLRGVKFTDISENKVLRNNSEFTVPMTSTVGPKQFYTNFT